MEDRDPTDFVESWLQELLGKEAFTTLFAEERVHRMPLPPGHLLSLARERTKIQYNGARVPFYPDFSADAQHTRATFAELKNYAMLYAAKL